MKEGGVFLCHLVCPYTSAIRNTPSFVPSIPVSISLSLSLSLSAHLPYSHHSSTPPPPSPFPSSFRLPNIFWFHRSTSPTRSHKKTPPHPPMVYIVFIRCYWVVPTSSLSAPRNPSPPSKENQSIFFLPPLPKGRNTSHLFPRKGKKTTFATQNTIHTLVYSPPLYFSIHLVGKRGGGVFFFSEGEKTNREKSTTTPTCFSFLAFAQPRGGGRGEGRGGGWVRRIEEYPYSSFLLSSTLLSSLLRE